MTMPPQSVSEEVSFVHPESASDSLVDAATFVTELPKAPPRRSVRFSNMTEVHSVLHFRDMSDEEISKAWVNGYDKAESRRVINNTVYLMKSGLGSQLTDEDFFCSRGLEHYCDETRSERINKSLKIALAMQRLLKRAGTRNPEMIARAYRTYTFKSQSAAHRSALKDQKSSSR